MKMMDAQKKCQSMGGDLPIIKSAEEDAFLTDLIKTNTQSFWGAWIGLIRKADSRFYWIDDTPLEGQHSNSAWASEEPNNYRGIEDCVNHYGKEYLGKWNDFPCEAGSNHNNDNPVVLCQKPL